MRITVEIENCKRSLDASRNYGWTQTAEWDRRLSRFPLYKDKMDGTLMMLQAAKVSHAINSLLKKEDQSPMEVVAIRGYLLVNPLLRQVCTLDTSLPGVFLSLVPTYYLLNPSHLAACLLSTGVEEEVLSCAHIILAIMGMESPSAFLQGRAAASSARVRLVALEKEKKIVELTHGPASKMILARSTEFVPSPPPDPSGGTPPPPPPPTSTSTSTSTSTVNPTKDALVVAEDSKELYASLALATDDGMEIDLEERPTRNGEESEEEPMMTPEALDKYIYEEASMEDVASEYGIRPEFLKQYRTIDGETLLSLAIDSASTQGIMMVGRLCPELVGTFDATRSSILMHVGRLVNRVHILRAIASALKRIVALGVVEPLHRLILHDIVLNGSAGLDIMENESSFNVKPLIPKISDALARQVYHELSAVPGTMTLNDLFKAICANKRKAGPVRKLH